MSKRNILLPPCTYQGAKQRVAKEIVDIIFERNIIYQDTKFFDLCCGTGTITLELLSRGIKPENIIMLDKSSWGLFWKSIGSGKYDINKFNDYIEQIPKDKYEIQSYLKELSKENPEIDEEYKYILLQAGSFGGKQIWKENNKWNNTSFRSYWQPTITSKRRSPVNPMQPMPDTIKQRMNIIVNKCNGLTCLHIDIYEILKDLNYENTENCIFYLDPPYKNTTGYGFKFDWEDFISELFDRTLSPIYVSECKQYADDKNSFLLNFRGKKGGISGIRKGKNQEWLNEFR